MVLMYAILISWWRQAASQSVSQYFPYVRCTRMEGLAAFVSKFDENSSRENNELKKMPPNNYRMNPEKKDSRSNTNQTNTLPFSIEGILGISDNAATKSVAGADTRIHSTEFNQGKTIFLLLVFYLLRYKFLKKWQELSWQVILFNSFALAAGWIDSLESCVLQRLWHCKFEPISLWKTDLLYEN